MNTLNHLTFTRLTEKSRHGFFSWTKFIIYMNQIERHHHHQLLFSFPGQFQSPALIAFWSEHQVFIFHLYLLISLNIWLDFNFLFLNILIPVNTHKKTEHNLEINFLNSVSGFLFEESWKGQQTNEIRFNSILICFLFYFQKLI